MFLLHMLLLHSRMAFGLLLPALFSPRGETWFFSWQSRGCWEGKAEPASFLVELEAWGTAAVVLWEVGGPSPLPPEPATLRRGRAARSPAGGIMSQRSKPVP